MKISKIANNYFNDLAKEYKKIRKSYKKMNIATVKFSRLMNIFLLWMFLFNFILFSLLILEMINTFPVRDFYPDKKIYTIKYTGYHAITAYNSEIAQTDGNPCVTANGFNVCEHGVEDTIAANFLKFGTKVRIPNLFGERIFVVRDRMNERYPNRVDVWMLDKQMAKKFGIRIAKIEVLE